jgi:hypothetical protein
MRCSRSRITFDPVLRGRINDLWTGAVGFSGTTATDPERDYAVFAQPHFIQSLISSFAPYSTQHCWQIFCAGTKGLQGILIKRRSPGCSPIEAGPSPERSPASQPTTGTITTLLRNHGGLLTKSDALEFLGELLEAAPGRVGDGGGRVTEVAPSRPKRRPLGQRSS